MGRKVVCSKRTACKVTSGHHSCRLSGWSVSSHAHSLRVAERAVCEFLFVVLSLPTEPARVRRGTAAFAAVVRVGEYIKSSPRVYEASDVGNMAGNRRGGSQGGICSQKAAPGRTKLPNMRSRTKIVGSQGVLYLQHGVLHANRTLATNASLSTHVNRTLNTNAHFHNFRRFPGWAKVLENGDLGKWGLRPAEIHSKIDLMSGSYLYLVQH